MNHLKADGKGLESPVQNNESNDRSNGSEQKSGASAGPSTSSSTDPHALENHQQRYLTEHSSCAMCDTKLEIKHDINKNDLKVKEEAHCPSCGIRVRSNHHLMH